MLKIFIPFPPRIVVSFFASKPKFDSSAWIDKDLAKKMKRNQDNIWKMRQKTNYEIEYRDTSRKI